MESALASAASIADQRQKIEKYKIILSSVLAAAASDITQAKRFIEHVVSDDVPLVVSRQLLQTFAQDLGRLEPEIQKVIAHYALAQIQPRVVSFEEQLQPRVVRNPGSALASWIKRLAPPLMEASPARRRLDSIAGHLLSQPLQEPFGGNLHQNHVVGSKDSKSMGVSPVIIGGMVLDIHAKPFSNPVPGTTTPGKVYYVSGGVARNIAECMSKLGSRPFMISVIGFDMAGDLLLDYWKSAGLPTEGILKFQGATTPVVSNIFDREGELAAGVASVKAVEKLVTPDWIQRFRCNIRCAPVLMVDANLHPKSLEAACQIAAESGIPIWFEPVSVMKSTRIAPVINYITCTSPNVDELIAMANAISPRKFSSVEGVAAQEKGSSSESLFQRLKPAICFLLHKGIRLLAVTLGSKGVFICTTEGPDFMKNAMTKHSYTSFGRQLYELVNGHCPSNIFASPTNHKLGLFYAYHFPALPATVVSVTGAGDSLVGGILASICSGLNMMQSVAVGIAVAKAAVESDTNVPIRYDLIAVADEAKQILSAAKPLVLD